jgi:hypothetical protein
VERLSGENAGIPFLSHDRKYTPTRGNIRICLQSDTGENTLRIKPDG